MALSLQQSVDAAALAVEPAPDDHSVLVFSTTAGFKPDAVLSLANSAAIYDSVSTFFLIPVAPLHAKNQSLIRIVQTYSKYQHVFRLVAPFGRQYLFQARDADDLNAWLAHINYAASFKTAGIRMRSLTPSSSRTHSSPATKRTAAPSVDQDLTLQALRPVSDDDLNLTSSLRQALGASGGAARQSFDHSFPSRTSSSEFSPESSTPPSSAPSTTIERGPDTRAEVLRVHFPSLILVGGGLR